MTPPGAKPAIRSAGALAWLGREEISTSSEDCAWLPFLYPRDRLVDGKRLLPEGAARTATPARRIAAHPTIPTVDSDDAAGRDRDARSARAAYWVYQIAR